ncbi:MAG TPA: alpha-N-arabinofuranosidase, partial [Rikenellaceae bacterium]|nr:alpha-N-arabinofuranosidase [Rikenellaceae bacterium]
MNKKHFISAAALCLCTPLMLVVCCKRAQDISDRPCDIYAAHGTPCVAAHSTTRLLNSAYNGPLYRVIRESDGTCLDVTADSRGYAFSELQDEFCKGTVCR